MVHFCNGVLGQELANSLTHHSQGHCHGGESTYQVRVRVFSSEHIPVTMSALPNNTADIPLVLVQWNLSELSSCYQRNTLVCSWPATETCVLFPAEVNSVFSTSCSVVLFLGCIANTMFHHRQWPYQTSLHCVKDQMKCEADVFLVMCQGSRHPNLPLQSAALYCKWM